MGAEKVEEGLLGEQGVAEGETPGFDFVGEGFEAASRASQGLGGEGFDLAPS